MMLNDPDEVALAEGVRMGLHPIQIICDEPDAKVGEPQGISFLALVAFVPRVGEMVQLPDGKMATVTGVYYQAVQTPGAKVVRLVPTVYTVRNQKR
jgi:hypothetical protein